MFGREEGKVKGKKNLKEKKIEVIEKKNIFPLCCLVCRKERKLRINKITI